MYRVIFLPKAERQLKRLTKKNKPLAKAFRNCVNEISRDPVREPKVGDLAGIWGYGFNFKGVDYRIAYIINENDLFVFVIGVGSHEGFWREIKRCWQDHV